MSQLTQYQQQSGSYDVNFSCGSAVASIAPNRQVPEIAVEIMRDVNPVDDHRYLSLTNPFCKDGRSFYGRHKVEL